MSEEAFDIHTINPRATGAKPDQDAGDEWDSRGAGSQQDRPRMNNSNPWDSGGGNEGPSSGGPSRLPFDPIRLLEALRNTWMLWLGAGVVLGLLGYFSVAFKKSLMADMKLVRREVPAFFKAGENGENFKPQQFSPQTLASIMKAPEVLKAVSEKTKLISPSALDSLLTVNADPESDNIHVFIKGVPKAENAVAILKSYAEEVIAYTRQQQAVDAMDAVRSISTNLAGVDRQLKLVQEQMQALPPEAQLSNLDKQTDSLLVSMNAYELKYETARIDLETVNLRMKAMEKDVSLRNPYTERLQAAKDALAVLLNSKTEANPLVIAQKSLIQSLEADAAKFDANPPKDMKIVPGGKDLTSQNFQKLETERQILEKQVQEYKKARDKVELQLDKLSKNSLGFENIKSRFKSLGTVRNGLESRRSEAFFYAEGAVGYFNVLTPPSLDRVQVQSNTKKALMLGFAGAFLGFFLVAGFVLAREIMDDHLKSAGDVARVTGLPILGTLGDLDKMDVAERNAWAFRTWTIIKGKLNANQTEGMVCGFISANHGEGRSTWIKLLINSANQRGLRVLTIATEDSNEPAVHPHEPLEQPKLLKGAEATPNLLSHPAMVSDQLTDPNSQAVVHIPLPGWAWNLERRKMWQSAVDQWSRIDNLVLLVELPPASEPESVLLAEKLPQIIWLADSGKPTIKQTKTAMETLRYAGCNIVGSVLNHEPNTFWQRHLSRWFSIAALLGCVLLPLQASAQTNSLTVTTNGVSGFSSSDPARRAQWQKRLTLGPGDVLHFGLYGDTNATKNDLAIGPDGRISYLEAQSVQAAGLTVDELRASLDKELGKYYRAPRTILTPVSYKSKKYYVMGKVMKKGVFVLDRPLTVVEALGRAGGLESGIIEGTSIDMADLERSFLVRKGRRYPLNFEKLFGGDLSQNMMIEPDDFLYFPSGNLKEVYVLGEVRAPGVVTYTSDSSAIAAIAQRAGFTDRAYKTKVLVVRGSLNKPQTFVVDALAILDGRAKDFKLEPKDIVYVHYRPFIYAEEMLDMAATAFVQSAVAAWAGANIGPLITEPFIPSPNLE